MTGTVKIIGAGLAGCEAAYAASKCGCRVKLYEMKPEKYSPAHRSSGFAELVCSNSLRSDALHNAVGILKYELRSLGSLIMEAAEACRVPAGTSLAVDREKFSQYITDKITSDENIEVIHAEISDIDTDEITVIATGPLTSDALSVRIGELTGHRQLHFFDAAAPIVSASSVDMTKAFIASRYGKGEAAYINCPMTREEYEAFYKELITAKQAQLHEFEKDPKVFEGCMPVEVMAKRGEDTLLYGPLKPVGLIDPTTGKMPYAVVQLRAENNECTMYNLVGFQTHLTFGEQKRVFGMIPALHSAEFYRYGVMHRNTFIDSPSLLDETYCMRQYGNIFFAGQITGVEGYIESTSSGMIAGRNAAAKALGKDPFVPSDVSQIGAMARYISTPNDKFQPMNANFGIMAPITERVKGGKRARVDYVSARACNYIDSIRGEFWL